MGHPANGPIELARIGTTTPAEQAPPPSPDLPAPAIEDDVDDAPPVRPRGRRPVASVATDEDLLRVLREADGPLLVSEIRTALRVDPDVPRSRVSAFLANAVERGIIDRTGQRRGTRYSATSALDT